MKEKNLWLLPQQSYTVIQPEDAGSDRVTSGWNLQGNVGQTSGQMITVDPASLAKKWLIHCDQLLARTHEQLVISYPNNTQAMQGAAIGKPSQNSEE